MTRTLILMVATASIAALLLAAPLSAQNQSVPENPIGSDVGELQNRIDELTERVKKLEERLDKPMSVRAPFTVTNARGNPLMTVNREGELTVGRSDKNSFRVYEDNGGMIVAIRSGTAQAGMSTNPDGEARVLAVNYSAGRQARLIADSSGVAVETKEKGEIAQIGVMNGSGRLKLWHNTTPFLVVDASKGPSIKLGNEEKPTFEVTDASEGATLTLKKSQGSVVMESTAAGISSVRAIASSNRMAIMEAASSLTKVQLAGYSSAQGESNEWIGLAMDDTEGARLRIFKDGNVAADLGTPGGKVPGLRLFEQGKLALQAGWGAQEQPSFAVFERDSVIALLGANNQNEGILQIGDPDKMIAQLGRESADKSNGLRIWDKNNDLVLGAGTDANGVPSIRLINKGKTAAGLMVENTGAGRLDLFQGENDGASLFMKNGVGTLELARADGKLAAQLGPGTSPNVALRIFGSDGKPLAGVGDDGDGDGIVRIHNKAGQPVAALQTNNSSGGDIAVFDSSGISVASLSGQGDLGMVQVFSGKEPIAVLTRGESDGGILQISSGAGETMVEAGFNGRVGVVRTGPMGRGAGMMGLGLPGSFIMGKSQ